ncbi:hypothetical protein [Streptomyces griseosporeus]|uniref:hypothetical protein n=1 Tax=Streptomyces griseosporeus TaxID=1910 RepID=UPI00167D04D1|nr:hypothetical protein [Streptomyces griseosporeus]GHF92156.1 hypothetical protein GCM10018783_73750 [Streptomyces griseosporeus]
MAVNPSLQGALHPIVSNVGATPPPKATPKPVVKKPTSTKKPAPKKKSPPKKQSATDKYLAGDTTYQQQLADFNRTKADYNANYTRQAGIVNRDYAESQRALNRQGAQDRLDQQDDFAGRGILHSGVFAKALGNYNTEFNARMKALTTGKTDQLGDLASQQKSFLAQLQTEMNNARQDAIRRRAAKLGI